VSMPSWEIFDAQPKEYRDKVLPPSIGARLAVEAAASQGWHRYIGDYGDVLLREHGFTVENVCKLAIAVMHKGHACS